MKKQIAIILIFLCATFIIAPLIPPGSSQSLQPIDSSTIPQFVNHLTAPPVYVPTNITDSSGKLVKQEYTVDVVQFNQQILPTETADGKPTGFPATTVWGYQSEAENAFTGQNLGLVASTPGGTFEAIQGVPVQVKWVNDLVNANGNPLSYRLPVDPTIHWANPSNMPMDGTQTNLPSFPPGYTQAQTPVPIVTHLHGGEDPSTSDGGPNAWFTADGQHGPDYTTEVPTENNSAVYIYPNMQQPTTLFYHDHALGLTRLNVLSGLAGFYVVSNQSDPVEQMLPSGQYDMPLAIQDRSFYSDGSLYYPTRGVNPTDHPYWQNTFLGNTIVVNGEAWPNMDVKQGVYRFRILDASNSRFYQLSFSNGMSFTQIGSDGGFLKAPALETTKLIAPAERIDILVDFSNVPIGTKVILKNTALIGGSSKEAQTVGKIMQFTVTGSGGQTAPTLPQNLNPTLAGNYPNLPAPSKTRILTLIDVFESNGLPSMMLLDGQLWAAPVSEKPVLGSTEDWVLVNPTMEPHPIHLHLIQFQIVSRQSLDSGSYMAKWTALNGDPPLSHSTVNVKSLSPYLIGSANPAAPSEKGWKDTVVVNSGEVVTIRVRWAEQNGNPFTFDATAGPGYVWHCHLLEHEDNEMMRPFIVVKPNNLGATEFIAVPVAVIIIAALAALLIFRRYRRKKETR
jgi:spore coat protein A